MLKLFLHIFMILCKFIEKHLLNIEKFVFYELAKQTFREFSVTQDFNVKISSLRALD